MLIRQLPVESRVKRAVGDPSLAWSLTEHLLALAVDALRGANWQRSPKGNPPEPIERPGQPTAPSLGQGRSYGTAMSKEDLDRRLHPERYEEGGTDGD